MTKPNSSDENYLYLETNQQRSFSKPNNYEKSETRKWKKDIGRRENMTYLADEDAYLCAQGRKLTITKEFIRKSIRPSSVLRSKFLYFALNFKISSS